MGLMLGTYSFQPFFLITVLLIQQIKSPSSSRELKVLQVHLTINTTQDTADTFMMDPSKCLELNVATFVSNSLEEHRIRVHIDSRRNS